jgi:dTDP-4-amino-4,6-dideoxygalactose transaminase
LADLLDIEFNKPVLVGNEIRYILEALERAQISGDGYFTKKCHAVLQDLLGVPKVLLTTSCTHALEMSALLLDIQAGDEVICPSFTFVSTINAFVLRGARPVFVDIRPDTLNLDETLLEEKITPRTKAILVVHYAGVGCEMDSILEIADHHNIPVIEDNAHGLFGKYKGRHLGTFGVMATQSFHETKNITSGEGGALLVNAPEYIERAEIVREKGTDRSRFFRGLVDKYTWVDIGSSYLPSDILAAFLYAQLEKWPEIQAKRRHIWEFYYQQLSPWAESLGIGLPVVPNHVEQSYHMFYLLLRPGIQAGLNRPFEAPEHPGGVHYLPLHQKWETLRRLGWRLPGHRGRQRPAAAAAVLQQPGRW